MTAAMIAKLEAAQDLIAEVRTMMLWEMEEQACRGRDNLSDRLAGAYCELHRVVGRIEELAAPAGEEVTA
jgi:hypothetical protein